MLVLHVPRAKGVPGEWPGLPGVSSCKSCLCCSSAGAILSCVLVRCKSARISKRALGRSRRVPEELMEAKAEQT